MTNPDSNVSSIKAFEYQKFIAEAIGGGNLTWFRIKIDDLWWDVRRLPFEGQEELDD